VRDLWQQNLDAVAAGIVRTGSLELGRLQDVRVAGPNVLQQDQPVRIAGRVLDALDDLVHRGLLGFTHVFLVFSDCKK
jgi:hypothetical protein